MRRGQGILALGAILAGFVQAEAAAVGEVCPGYLMSERHRRDLTALLRPSLLRIQGTASASNGLSDRVGPGSGFYVTSDGLILTANHVVAPFAGAPSVSYSATNAGSSGDIQLELVGQDEANDLALLRVTSSRAKSAPLPLVSTNGLELNQLLLGAGYPGRLRLPAVGFGHLLGTDEDTLLTDLAVARGQSGGPVLTRAGEVVGVIVSSPDGLGSTVKVAAVEAARDWLESFGVPVGAPHVAIDPAALTLPADPPQSCPELRNLVTPARTKWMCAEETVRPDRSGAERYVEIPLPCAASILQAAYFHRSRGAKGELGEHGPWKANSPGDFPWAQIDQVEVVKSVGDSAVARARCRNWSDRMRFSCAMGLLVEDLLW